MINDKNENEQKPCDNQEDAKARFLETVHEAYDKLLKTDQRHQDHKPEFMRQMNDSLTEALKPLFT